MLAAVKQDGLFLGKAHPDLQKDIEIVFAAVSQTRSALRYVDSSFTNTNNSEVVATWKGLTFEE